MNNNSNNNLNNNLNNFGVGFGNYLSGSIPDAYKVLSGLLGSINPSTGMNPVGILSNIASGTSNQTYSPYKEGVIKALKKAGEAHASEALASGVPSEQIEQKSGISNSQQLNYGQLQNSPTVGYNNKMNSNQPNQPNPPNPQNQNNQQNNVNNNGFNLANVSPLNLLGPLLGYHAGNINPQTGEYMPASILGIQSPNRLEGQQAANAIPTTKLALLQAEKNMPMSRYEKAQVENTAFQRDVDAKKATVDAYKQMEQDTTNLIQQLGTMRNFIQRGLGLKGGDISKSIRSFKETHNRLSDSIDELERLSTSRVKFSDSNSDSNNEQNNTMTIGRFKVTKG